MRVSQLLTKTLRESPTEADSVSHRLLLRAGLISPLIAGVFSYLPLGWRAIRKIEAIIREEMDRAGGQEVLLPTLQPMELWEETDRVRAFGQGLFTLRDRRERRLVLAPTHEEVITQIVHRYARSYRDLPLRVYQLQTKFRDEARPRGGLLRTRQFIMKDLYSFDADEEGLDKSYRAMIEAYQNIFRRCGLETVMVEADSGAIGGKESHEFMVPVPSGEDMFLNCPDCGYAANAEKASCRKGEPSTEELLPLEEVGTPGIITIADLTSFLDIPENRTLKAVFYWADGGVVFGAIRGDLGVNEVKLKNLLKAVELRLATEEEVAKAGLVAGSASPLGLRGIKTVADDSVALGRNLVAGGNRPGVHVKNVNYPRDFKVDLLADIALAQEGKGCPHCGHPLAINRGIEVGHVFKLGTIFSEKLGARYLDRQGRSQTIVMGCYGIGVERTLAAVMEYSHDERGIIFPASVAPFQVYLCSIHLEHPGILEAAEGLYQELQKKRLEVLYDDRPESPGVKFNDADLLGLPLRLTLSPRTLESQAVEVKRRTEKEGRLLPLEGLAPRLKKLLAS